MIFHAGLPFYNQIKFEAFEWLQQNFIHFLMVNCMETESGLGEFAYLNHVFIYDNYHVLLPSFLFFPVRVSLKKFEKGMHSSNFMLVRDFSVIKVTAMFFKVIVYPITFFCLQQDESGISTLYFTSILILQHQ